MQMRQKTQNARKLTNKKCIKIVDKTITKFHLNENANDETKD
jgi:hypothetical protein